MGACTRSCSRRTGRRASRTTAAAPHVAADIARRWGVRATVGVPIHIEGRLWGVIGVASRRDESLPAGTTEAWLTGFTELVAAAIANAEAQAELTASRARIVAAGDTARHRIERDLHDGAQQRLVSLALQVRAAQAAVPPNADELSAELERLAEGLAAALDELHEIAPRHSPRRAQPGRTRRRAHRFGAALRSAGAT